MPNVVNEFLLEDLQQDFQKMGSCLVLSFDKLTVERANEIRNKFREAGVTYKVVKNRLAIKALDKMGIDMREAFRGKCGIVLAEEEGAISAAKIVRDYTKKDRKRAPLKVVGGVIEGEPIVGDQAKNIADMPDKDTVRAQLAGVISGPARGLAACLAGLPGGLARVLQAKIDKGE